MSGRRHPLQGALAIALSFSFHGATMAVLDVVELSASPPPEPAMEFFELEEPVVEVEPEPEVVPEPEPEPDPEPEVEPEPRAAPPPRRRDIARRESPADAASPEELSPDPAPGLVADADLAVDLTGFRLSSAQVGSPGGTGTRPSRGPSTGSPDSAAPGPAGPRFAPAASLSRPPAPPDQGSIVRCLERSYPRQARQQGLAGSARVRLNIAPSGTPSGLRVVTESTSGQGFGEACISCLRGNAWTAPLDGGGQPVGTRTTYTCRFSVR